MFVKLQVHVFYPIIFVKLQVFYRIMFVKLQVFYNVCKITSILSHYEARTLEFYG